MTEEQQFCLRWNDFQTNMVASFKHLRDEKSFCDVTIATEVNSCSFLIEILRTLDCPWIKGLGASFDIPFIKSSRVNTPKPTRWSYAPAPPTSRICWIRTPPSIPLSSWRYIGDCFISTDASLPGCTIRSPECHPGVHVCWRGEISCFLKKLHVLFFFGRNDYSIMAGF